MKYTAINIGPIIGTFSMVRKPRELWAASYLFSFLMNCIIQRLPASEIISPAKLDATSDKTIGLYPDRVFVKGNVNQEVLDDIIIEFATKINLDITVAKQYFNIMSVTIEEDENSKRVIPRLNQLLDCMELCNINADESARMEVQNYLSNCINRLEKVVGKKFNNSSIETIASIDIFENEQKTTAIADKSDKYICIVQADGDNMGKVVSSLSMNSVSALSECLLNFGQRSCEIIRAYGGLPIYAGGDDLLFLTPILSSKGTILNLIEDIDKEYKNVQKYVEEQMVKDTKGNDIETSMSYGIGMTYYKFPLYEALESSRNLLFDTAKSVDNKNAIAWILQKHAGSSFKAAFSKKNEKLYKAFIAVTNATEDELLVSAVSHKIRSNEGLLSLWLGETNEIIENRLDNFFEKIIDVESKSESAKEYIKAVKEMLTIVYLSADSLSNEPDRLKKMKELTTIVYGMLRTAKFIKGKEENK